MKISVIIPVYNRADYLSAAVESVMATEYEDLEVLIVDDGSSDLSLEVARKLQHENHNRIRVLQHSAGAHLGISESRNLGILESAGSVICFLDSDDAFLPNRFTAAAAALQRDPSLDGCYEPIIRIEDPDFQNFVDDWHDRTGPPPGHLVDSNGHDPADLLRGLLLEGRAFWNTPAITVRSSLFDKTGLFDRRFPVAEDTHLWLRMAAVGRLRCVQRSSPVAAVRRHSDHSWQPTLEEGNRVFTLAVADVLEWARGASADVDPEIAGLLEQGLYRSAVDTLILLREGRRWGTAVATLYRVLRAAPKLTGKNLLWRKALEPRRFSGRNRRRGQPGPSTRRVGLVMTADDDGGDNVDA